MPPPLRRIFVFAIAAVCCLLAARPASSPAAFELKLCDNCRRIWDDSGSRMRAVVDARGRDKLVLVCSPFCMAAVLRRKPYYELLSATIVNWDERGKLDAGMVSVNNAKLLVGATDKDDLSHDPDVAAFRSDKQLAAGRKSAGGQAISWDKLLEKCRKLAAETDDTRESTYQPKNHRRD
ncbi:MAG: hypothetical protein M3R04_00075 [bacterium]|nr:hypothetical protein [bacterium]